MNGVRCLNCGAPLVEDPGTRKTSRLMVHENGLAQCPNGRTWASWPWTPPERKKRRKRTT